MEVESGNVAFHSVFSSSLPKGRIREYLSLPGIAGYEWVPARIGRFYKDKIFFS